MEPLLLSLLFYHKRHFAFTIILLLFLHGHFTVGIGLQRDPALTVPVPALVPALTNAPRAALPLKHSGLAFTYQPIYPSENLCSIPVVTPGLSEQGRASSLPNPQTAHLRTAPSQSSSSCPEIPSIFESF